MKRHLIRALGFLTGLVEGLALLMWEDLMRRMLAGLCVLLLVASWAEAQSWNAVVRITLPAPRRGVAGLDGAAVNGSGTVIFSQPGRTLVLSCAHLWLIEGTTRLDPRLLRRPIWVDAPAPKAGAHHTGRNTLAYICAHRDLAIVVMPVQLPYVCPVAPAGTRPGRCVSAGYDLGKAPMTVKWTTLSRAQGDVQFTVQHPVSGRSGGALIDHASGRLIGVCQAVQMDGPGGRPVCGVYASHRAVLDFLNYYHNHQLRGGAAAPRALPRAATLRPAPPGCAPGGT